MLSRDVNYQAAERFSQFAGSRAALLLLGAWAFFEPSFWFIAPDLLLWLMCLYSPKKYVRFFLVTLASSLAGACLYFALNLLFFEDLHRILLATPFVNDGMILRIESVLAAYGMKGLLLQSFSFISIKIWVHLAVEHNIPLLWFIILTGLSRALRFFLFALLFSRVGLWFGIFLKRYFISFVTLYVLGFMAVLVLLETTVVSR
jgi:membrane protein YqaA with SNARE-associated domain